MILRGLTGNLDVPGGHVLSRDLPLADMKLPAHRPAGLRVLGTDRYPLFAAFAEFIPGDVLVDAMLTGQPHPVKAALVMGTNPALTYPNTPRVRQALEQLDLLVVMDMFMTATARLADIVLPAASPYERTQLITGAAPFGVDQPQCWIALRQGVVDPGERRSDWWLLRNLGHRLGYGAYYPWESEEEAIDAVLQPLGITVAELKARPSGMFYGNAPDYRSYEREGFRTPTGKVEFYSHVLASYGYDPLPHYEEPAESPFSTPELAQAYPLVLNAGYRVAGYTHSRHRNLPSLRKRVPEPIAGDSPDNRRAVRHRRRRLGDRRDAARPDRAGGEGDRRVRARRGRPAARLGRGQRQPAHGGPAHGPGLRDPRAALGFVPRHAQAVTVIARGRSPEAIPAMPREYCFGLSPSQ